jgi:hypothetical protein
MDGKAGAGLGNDVPASGQKPCLKLVIPARATDSECPAIQFRLPALPSEVELLMTYARRNGRNRPDGRREPLTHINPSFVA